MHTVAPMPKRADVVRARMAAALLAFALALLGVLAAHPTCAFATVEDGASSRALAIAYDNSGSMVTDSDKWCGANYSLEVLAAMLDSNDEMVVYTMESAGQKLAVSGSAEVTERVRQVHETDLQVSDQTDPHAAREACDYLKSSAADERYLIITTDGVFNTGGKLDEVKQIVKEASDDGIAVIYLAIGGDAETIDSDTDKGIYVKLAPSSDTILSTMVDIANQVFGRDALPESALAGSTVSFDVPMSELIVFAQGEDVHVGDLTMADGQVIQAEGASVRYKDRPSADTKYDPFKVDANLQGTVCAFRGQIPRGQATLDIEGASNVEVYYTPYVGIALDLKEAETGISYRLQPNEANELSAGSYSAEPYFVDPLTGEAITSDLLKDPVFELALESGGNVEKVEPGGLMAIEPGTVTILATAVTNGSVRVSQDYQGVNVSPAVSVMTLDVSAVPGVLAVADFGDESYPITVAKENGEPITDEEWAQMEFEAQDEAGVVWKVEKTDEVGRATCKPTWTDGDAWKTQRQLVGTFPLAAKGSTLHFTAQTATQNQIYRANADAGITYTGDWMNVLRHLWLPLLLILIALFLLVKFITKPRLPRKMSPHLVIQGMDDPVALSYSERKIENRYSPFGPERIAFNAHSPKDSMMASYLSLDNRFELGRVGLVAAKKEGGKRRFRFDEQTLAEMRRHMSEAEERGNDPFGFPNPDYQPKPAKSYKDQKSTRGIGSTIQFTGYNIPPLGQRRSEERYTLYFRKPR